MTNTFHEPHPAKEIDQAAVRTLREFLRAAGVGPDNEGI